MTTQPTGKPLPPGYVCKCPFLEQHGCRASEATPAPICTRCNDTHLVDAPEDQAGPFGDGKWMCTSCPSPCQQCRAGGNGPFCETTPCACACHAKHFRYAGRRTSEACSSVVASKLSETSRNTRDGATPPLTSQAANHASTSAPGFGPGGPGGSETTEQRPNDARTGLQERMHGRLERMAADARYRAQRLREEETADAEAAEDAADEAEFEAAIIERCANALVSVLREAQRTEPAWTAADARKAVVEWLQGEAGAASADAECALLSEQARAVLDGEHVAEQERMANVLAEQRRESASLPVNHPVSMLLASFAGFIVRHFPPEKHCDHACAECVPGGEIVREGFQCVPHKALAMVRGSAVPEGKETKR